MTSLAPRSIQPGHDNRSGSGLAGHILIVSAGVGAGHDGAGEHLRTSLIARGYAVTVLDFLDLLPGRLGWVLRDIYRVQLRVAPQSWEWLLTAIQHNSHMTASVRRLVQLAKPHALRLISEQTSATVSTYPLASHLLGNLRIAGHIRGPVITYLTDMSVHPLWVADGVDTHLALHGVPARQARRHGAGDVRVIRPTVGHSFVPRLTSQQKAHARQAFGLPTRGNLALITTGSWGVGEIEHSAHDVAATGLATPVVACGNNDALRSRLATRGVGVAMGWVTDMSALLHACDVVVQNAGGLTCLEALISGLPVISYRCLPGHGQANAAALEEAGWCAWPRDKHHLAQIMQVALADQPSTQAFDQVRANDAPTLIDQIAGQRKQGQPASADPSAAHP